MYQEAVAIKKRLGLGMTAFGTAIGDGDPEAIGMVVWLAMRRKVGPVAAPKFEDLDFDLTAVMNTLNDEPGEPPAEAEPVA